MLDQFLPYATIAVADLERAKTWYAEKLGMNPVKEDEVGAWYESGGGRFLMFPTPHAGTAKNTVMEWPVDDVDAEVQILKERGVVFDTFELEGITWDGEVATMGDYKAAWFSDADGNVLAISNY
jgi:catechol 2,3-dioxygenase-like lactoylglutathione lyase family enzyme